VQRKILEAFIEAVQQVFLEMDIVIDTVGVADDAPPDDQVITSVGLTGDLKGIFMIHTDRASAGGLLRAMTGGMRLSTQAERLSEIQLAALGELSNQISGRAITLLSELNLHCDITPPAIVAADKLTSHVPDLAVSFRRSVRGPFGHLTLFIGVQDIAAPESIQKN
jgi:chemotaxis protein CheX